MTATTPIMLISSFGYFAISLVIWNYFLVLSFYPAAFLVAVKFFYRRQQRQAELKKAKQLKQEQQEQQQQGLTIQQEDQKVIQITETRSARKLLDISPNDAEVQEYGKVAQTIMSPTEAQVMPDQVMEQVKKNGKLGPDIPVANGDNEMRADDPSEFWENQKPGLTKISIDNGTIITNKQEQEIKEEHKEKYNIVERFFFEKYSPKLFKFRYIVLLIFLCWLIITVYYTSQLQAPKEVTQTAPKSNIIRKGKDHVLDFHAGKNDNVIKIFFLWGIAGIDRDTIDNKWDSNDKGSAIWDNTFDLSASQQRIYDICVDLKENYVGGELVQKDGLDCFMFDFKVFAEDNNYTFPVPQDKFMTAISDYTENNLIGKEYIHDHYIGIMKNRVQYLKLTIYGKTYLVLQRKEQEPLFQKWESIIKKYNDGSDKTCNKALQTAGLGWEWMVTEKKLIDQTILSLICTGSFAMFILCCSTLNWLISLYSTFSIVGIVIGILALIKMFGWYLGLIESIAAGIVVGFSVEYIVFLCINFLIVDQKTRYLKTQRSLLNMGISILGLIYTFFFILLFKGGAITTLGAGFFLIFGKMDFFPKMGKLLMCTIAFSLLWSLIFFCALCMVIGPMMNTGSLYYYFKCLTSKCSRKNKQ